MSETVNKTGEAVNLLQYCGVFLRFAIERNILEEFACI